MVIGKSLPNTLAGISLPKAEISNICMKDGEPSLLTQQMMTEEYIRDVKEAAKQLGHGDDAVVNLLKATMLMELYSTLYGHNNLPLLCTMLKDIYAKKPQPTTATSATTTPGATAPFTLLRTPIRTPIKHIEDPSLEEKVNHLTEALYHMDLKGKPIKKPFKPFLTQPRRKFKANFDKGCNG